MAKATSNLTWQEINPTTLPEGVQKLYAEYKAAYAVMKDARGAFEAAINKGAPDGKRIVCGYNFGKLSLALADAEAPKVSKSTGSLADFLSANAGRRV